MATEIERKFLVTGFDWRTAAPLRISQGYLNRDRHRTVRVRIAGDDAFLTVKGVTTGATRAEFEYGIPRPVSHEVRHGGRIQGFLYRGDVQLRQLVG